jgi:hypothetical protein
VADHVKRIEQSDKRHRNLLEELSIPRVNGAATSSVLADDLDAGTGRAAFVMAEKQPPYR